MNQDQEQHPVSPELEPQTQRPLDDVEMTRLYAYKSTPSILSEQLKGLIDRVHKQEALEAENKALKEIILRADNRLRDIENSLGGDSSTAIADRVLQLRMDLTKLKATNAALLIDNTELKAKNRKLEGKVTYLELNIEKEHVASWRRIQEALPERPLTDDDESSLTDYIVCCIETLVRENEALARQIPPPPPADEHKPKPESQPDMGEVIRKLPAPGWFRVAKLTPEHGVFIYAGRRAGYIVACNLYENTITGAITPSPMKATDILELP